MSEMKHSTVLNVDGKDISNDEAKSAARKERLKQVTRLTFLLNITQVGERACKSAVNLTSMFIPDSLKKLGKKVFKGYSKLAPSNITVSSSEAVVAYLRWKQMPIAQASIEGEIQAIKAIVGDNPKAPFEKERESKMKSFQLSFDRPLLVKFFIQTFPDDATTDSQTLAAAKNKTAMAGIIDYTARKKATTLQTKMFGELEAADIDAAQATFDQLKVYCDDQAKRLGDLTLSS
ncbi:hypothetical protein TL16_g05440 [Triparma laevis f. inornata]|uniref:Uncharacterized protein n=1 Tax=Triparma laevis f. inornata TaxID=1714386 RepID=A0A9W7E979_9STRA|nr:hypothetical protein TL16_g05440 [Triparma laevis f. inornata]